MTRDNHETRSIFRLRGILLNSLVESITLVIPPSNSDGTTKVRATGSSRRTRGYYFAFFLVVLLPYHVFAQNKSAAYRETIVHIQQQIESGNLDAARAQITEASKSYPADGGLDNLLGVVEIQQGHEKEARQPRNRTTTRQITRPQRFSPGNRTTSGRLIISKS